MKTVDVVREIISRHIDISNLSNDDALNRFGLDSLDIVEISTEMEETFKIEFMSEEMVNIKTMSDIVNLIERKTK